MLTMPMAMTIKQCTRLLQDGNVFHIILSTSTVSTRKNSSYPCSGESNKWNKQMMITLIQLNKTLHLLQAHQHQRLKQSRKFHALHMNSVDHLFSMPRISTMAPLGWVAILDISQGIIGSVVRGHNVQKLSSCSGWRDGELISSQPDPLKVEMSVENARADLIRKFYDL